uniref:K+ dependent na+ca2+ antiporter n=1 Tax=Rhipicephalus zambeziensis TaxID=60191 RepID=A0A224YRY2_9ACAR
MNVTHCERACDRVHHLNLSQQCDFVYGNEECHSDEQYLAYTTFVYCAFGSGQTVPGLVVLALGLLVMFVGLGITADDFLTPSLIVISDSLHLSQNIAVSFFFVLFISNPSNSVVSDGLLTFPLHGSFLATHGRQ